MKNLPRLFALIITTCLNLVALPALCGATSQGSLYQVKFELKDQDGKVFDLSSLKGSNVVLVMAYTSCKKACPLTMQRLFRIETALKKAKKSEVSSSMVGISSSSGERSASKSSEDEST